MIGETLGSYKVVSKLGEGGMGVVYLAEHALLGRKAAVKVLRPEKLSASQETVNRFFNEARATSLIKHSGLIDVFDFGYLPNGAAYIIMEFLEGESLGARLDREGRLAPDVLLQVARQIAGGLSAAHAKEIVHRDLKPDNVFLVPDDVNGGLRVKILDFGIAKLAGEANQGVVKTRTGSMMGTPLYMSPEQCRGAGAVDGRADIYSFGCMLYEMVCGQPPFLGDGPGDVIVGHLTKAPSSLSALEPTVKPELEALIMRCLAKRPDERPASFEAVIGEIDAISGRGRAGMPVTPADWALGVSGGPTPGVRNALALGDTVTPPVGTSIVRGTGVPGAAHAPPVSPRATGVGQSGVHVAVAAVAADAEAVTHQPDAAARRPDARVSTTMGAAAGQSLSRPGPTPTRKSTALIVGAVALVAVGGVLFFVLRGGSGGKANKATVAAPTPPAPAPAPTPAPAAAPAPQIVHLSLGSDPAGAEIYRAADGVLVGRTPHVEDLPKGQGEAIYILKLAGYDDARVTMSIAADGEVTTPLIAHAAVAAVKPGAHTSSAGKAAKPGKAGKAAAGSGAKPPAAGDKPEGQDGTMPF